MESSPLAVLGRTWTIALFMVCACESQSTNNVWDCPLMLQTCEILYGIPGVKGSKGQPGLPGYVGPPGLPGLRGRLGEPAPFHVGGEIYIKGAKGERGSPGKRGPPGHPGPFGEPGVFGNAGRPGKKGVPGRKGDTGFPGSPGLKGDAGDVANVNWKQYTFTLDINKQIGEIHACTFQKLLSNTALHVTYQGDTHVGLCGTCCKKWEFLFDGKPCSSPGPIEAVYDNLMLVISDKPNFLPVFWHGSISGYCSNQLAGPMRVAMVINNCSEFPTDSILVSTEVNAMGRIIIQEVPPSQP